MGKDILHRVGNGGHCGCETVSREVLPQVEIPEKWTQEPPCFAITIWCAIKIAHQKQYSVFIYILLYTLWICTFDYNSDGKKVYMGVVSSWRNKKIRRFKTRRGVAMGRLAKKRLMSSTPELFIKYSKLSHLIHHSAWAMHDMFYY